MVKNQNAKQISVLPDEIQDHIVLKECLISKNYGIEFSPNKNTKDLDRDLQINTDYMSEQIEPTERSYIYAEIANEYGLGLQLYESPKKLKLNVASACLLEKCIVF